MTKTKILITLFCGLYSCYMHSVDFENLSGADLMIGIGAQQIALGGAGTLVDDNPGSIYWNAANLADMSGYQLQIDFESPALVKNFIFIYSPEFLRIGKRKISLGISRINRLRIIGESDDVWTGYAAHLLDLTFTSHSNFQGKIDSDTNDYRFSVAFQATERLNIGATFVRLV
jgi:hypothetical protein